MSKVKTAFFCQNCGSQYSKWQGQCNSCKSWNTIVEELITISKPKSGDLLKSKEIKIFKSLALNHLNTSIINESNLGVKNLFADLGIFLIEK